MSKAPANMTGLKIAYSPRPDATPERELNALVAVYRFIFFENGASKKGAPESAPDDGTKVKEDSADASIIR